MDIKEFINLSNLKSPDELKDKTRKELKAIANEIRELILKKSKQTDIHLSSNLGIIELSVSILKIFNPSNDFILYDTGHQTYTHKILTNRFKDFIDFKNNNNMCGLMNMQESKYDKYSPGHSGNILSVASGIYQKYADNNFDKHYLYKNEKNIVCVIGDSAFANGLTFEALNDVSYNKEPIIIILNDNGMSISKSVGYTSKAFSKIKSLSLFHVLERSTRFIFGYGKIYNFIFKGFNWIQWRLIGKNLFENLGYQYIGPIQGHNINKVSSALKRAKWFAKQGPVIVHVKTNKGKGDSEAEIDQRGSYHSYINNESKSYGVYATNKLIELMNKYKDIMVINPAMTHASNCELIQQMFPKRYFDVGIAEEHAISKASGMALNGLKPYIYIYSTFLQRAYDQLQHDLNRLKLKSILLIDRADLSSWEGDTHHGIYDVELLKTLDDTIITMPRNIKQLNQLIDLSYKNKPNSIWAIRYLKNDFIKLDNLNLDYAIEFGKWEIFKNNTKSKTIVISYGSYVNLIYKELFNKYKIDIANAIFITGYDKQQLVDILKQYKNIIVYERIHGTGGLIKDINELIVQNKIDCNVISMHFTNNIGYGKISDLEHKQNMHITDIEKILKKLN